MKESTWMSANNGRIILISVTHTLKINILPEVNHRRLQITHIQNLLTAANQGNWKGVMPLN